MNGRRVELKDPASLYEWREHARILLREGIAPEHVHWNDGTEPGLFAGPLAAGPVAAGPVPAPRVPRAFVVLADQVLAHRDRQRHALLYRLLWRIAHGEPQLLQVATDLDVARAQAWARAVQRELHHMHAFLRFRAVPRDNAPPVYVAWFEPEHFILERAAPFFEERFASMQWAILTPYRSVHWDGDALRYGPGADRTQAPTGDELESLWQVYYSSVFNPARLNTRLMKSHMPARYWKNMPEAQAIPELSRQASATTAAMLARGASRPRKRFPAPVAPESPPARDALEALAAQARDCRRCPLWQPATQTVWGQGPRHASVMLVGEQPGDQEDLAGRPFVGPAGQLLDRALEQSGLRREELYLTNAVKHFKFQPLGKRRLHQTASAREQAACLPWLEEEIVAVQPQLIVCLGAVATRAVLGRTVRLGDTRGRWHESPHGIPVFVTVHPAYLLRLLDETAREQEYALFVAELRDVGRRLGSARAAV